MRHWVLSPDGVLGISNGTGWSPATADEVYRSIVEQTPPWEDLPGGKCGAAADLAFSPYPVAVALVLSYTGDDRPEIAFQARTQQGLRFPLSEQSVFHGHAVHGKTWYPVSSEDSETLVSLIAEAGLGPPVRPPSSLSQCLALRKAAVEGKPVIDQLPDRVLLNLRGRDAGDHPAGIAASLYPYQSDGWRWLRFLIREHAGRPAGGRDGAWQDPSESSARFAIQAVPSPVQCLVIAPGSLLENWVREIAKFSPTLHVTKHHGPERTGRPSELRSPDVVVTSYETAVRDLSLLKMIEWEAVVLDEAQGIRNPEARRTKAVKQLGRSASIAVTGTPVENRLRDLWSIMDFVVPGYLGTLAEFEARFADTDADAAALEPLVSPLILRRRIQDVAQDLPPRVDIPEILEFDEDEASAYEAVRAAISREYGAGATLVSLLRLRQFCSHPALLDDIAAHRQYLEVYTSEGPCWARCSCGVKRCWCSPRSRPWRTG